MRFPHLAHRSAAAHKLHSTPPHDGTNLISGNDQTSSRLPAFSLFLPGTCPNNRDRRRPARSAVWELALKKAALLGAAIGLALATPVYADPIVLFGLTPNGIVFTSIGGDKLEVTVPVGSAIAGSHGAQPGTRAAQTVNRYTGPPTTLGAAAAAPTTAQSRFLASTGSIQQQ
jgi:hypothetical protein